MLNAENVNLRFFDNSISGRFQRFIRHLETYQNHWNRWMFLVIKRRIRDWIYLILFLTTGMIKSDDISRRTRVKQMFHHSSQQKWDCARKKSKKSFVSQDATLKLNVCLADTKWNIQLVLFLRRGQNTTAMPFVTKQNAARNQRKNKNKNK